MHTKTNKSFCLFAHCWAFHSGAIVLYRSPLSHRYGSGQDDRRRNPKERFQTINVYINCGMARTWKNQCMMCYSSIWLGYVALISSKKRRELKYVNIIDRTCWKSTDDYGVRIGWYSSQFLLCWKPETMMMASTFSYFVVLDCLLLGNDLHSIVADICINNMF